jgi:hypothetical protein
MGLQNMQVSADDADLVLTDAGTSPSGGSTSVTVSGYAPDFGALQADFQAKSTIVGGLTPYV